MAGSGKSRDGARMSYWIADALHRERERRGVEISDVARALRVSDRTIKRLEAGSSMGRNIDGFVAGYAYLLGLEDGREFWRRSLERWQQHGAPPEFASSEGPAKAFADAIRLAALRQSPDGSAQSQKPPAIQKRRAAE